MKSVLDESFTRGLQSILDRARSALNGGISQKPLVKEGDVVSRGDILADGPSIDMGELALGQNMRIRHYVIRTVSPDPHGNLQVF